MDALRRASRTLLQAGFIEAIIQCLVAFGVPLNNAQHGAIIALGGFLIAFAQNLFEDRGGYALLYPNGEKP